MFMVYRERSGLPVSKDIIRNFLDPITPEAFSLKLFTSNASLGLSLLL